ncbi:putative histone-lysine N-methyltransferase chromatin remodeling SET family [Helianthus annuus]|uniref:Histone-lysine N-methyltransferase chromatin remodeling SET family n=2 Tax=Helianthus annuus TaxID=4232 RepID=A0A9K3NJ96_HELAN|nr:probable inactive histone-lysine N-methyltransferase SUVR2 isoform X2 [Helianthus annuus]KAF5801593.1 putative histone-lysine N-methyltransferase chromatin remodeling SET family [Helianthus annuus]KAJ0559877.1 putative [histone H3]-lysine(4) N-trimethyltransferase chromatin remodeling SET family [Helianthus annuus]KAJ0566007.1 putative [histone H3]-lysine(4) N-trimethyltransferase chromatin remodeling SET family [Helianthus annuus]KAJ0572865.1 putative [histone H3]-lysine(4) N-trimethyltrans
MNPRVEKAFRAMRNLGIPDKKTKPVLKYLLKLYEKKWELIEQENYRVLADAIFENETEVAEQKKKLDDAEAAERERVEQAERMKAIEDETQIQEEPEKPLKRMRARYRDDEASPSCVSPNISLGGSLPVILIKPKDELLTDDPLRVEVPLDSTTPDLEPEPPVNTDAISPTENGVEENDNLIPDETVHHIAKRQESVANTDAISPTVSLKTGNDFEKETETAREDNNRLNSDETVDVAKGQESAVKTDAMSPTVSLKTRNDFEMETETGREEYVNVILDETVDIAKGEESVVISYINEVNSELPPSFHYIPRNAVFQNAYVNFSLARIPKENCCSTCVGNCLTSSSPCQCALQTGGEFSYTSEGTMKEDILDHVIETNSDPQTCHFSYCKECPLEKAKAKNEGVLGTCKGHKERSFIKECWLKCGCSKKCGNRVVQRGIRYKLQVFMTPAGGKGWGLRALEDLPKGAFVCEFVGEVLTCKELYNRVSQSDKKDEYAYPIFLDAEWGKESELQEDKTLCLDPTSYGNVARFINHRCFDANLVEIPVEVENPDRHYYHVAFFTTRKVKALEELTRDYGIEFDDNDDLIKAFKCQCGSAFCRFTKGSSGSRKRKCAQT